MTSFCVTRFCNSRIPNLTLVNSNKVFFPWAIRIFHQVKWHPIKWHFDYLKVLTMEVDLCFPTLCFSSLFQTLMDCINKQLLVDVNWLNKAIMKSALCQAKNFFMWDSISKTMDTCTNNSITFMVFLNLTFPENARFYTSLTLSFL